MISKQRENRHLSWLTVLAPILACACGTTHSSATSGAGVIITYPKQFLLDAANERDNLISSGHYPDTIILLDDYGKTRDTIRAAQ